ncbi:hypothetical protein ACFLWN_04470, partial [Chloroflexota bacterium]
ISGIVFSTNKEMYMRDLRGQAISALKTLVVSRGISLTDDDLAILEGNPKEAEKINERLSQIYEAMFYGFFHCAAEGCILVPENRIPEEFGHSLNENYPEANDVFLNFAKTYWTLRILTYDLMKNDIEWVGAQLLGKLEQIIGPVFFPFPGPAKIAPSKREKDQTELIKESGANINIEDFIRGNPILIRDRKQQRGSVFGHSLVGLASFLSGPVPIFVPFWLALLIILALVHNGWIWAMVSVFLALVVCWLLSLVGNLIAIPLVRLAAILSDRKQTPEVVRSKLIPGFKLKFNGIWWEWLIGGLIVLFFWLIW